MKKYILTFISCAIATVAVAQFSSAPAFPGAEGYGRYATGGRGAGNSATVTIKHVTNLDDSGTGSLRDAVNGNNRIIVFDVAGTIELKSQLKISKSNITILGQTAPGDGICLKGQNVNIGGDNIIIRYIRFRMGADSGTDADALNSYRHQLSTKKNIIIDHCSMSWSTDECATLYGVTDFTFQWNIVSESLRNAGHIKGSHGYGGIWGGERASFHHNLLAHHDSRNPRLDHDYVSYQRGPVDLVNNVIYNWGGNSCYGGDASSGVGGYKKYNIVNCYYKPGPYTKKKDAKIQRRILDITVNCSNCNSGDNTTVPGHFYVNGNYMYGNAAVTANNRTSSAINNYRAELMSDAKFVADDSRFQYKTISMQTAEKAFDKVLDFAGCSYRRDAVDERVVKETRDGTYTYEGSNGSTGGLIDSQEDVGGWPVLKAGTRPVDSDGDGIPDEWETANGLNPNSASDAVQKTVDTRGYYTNIEVYANSLVEELVKVQRAEVENGETFEEYYPAFNIPTGIDSVDCGKSAVKVEYFSLDGCKLPEPAAGINIRKVTFSNGSTKTDKVIK